MKPRPSTDLTAEINFLVHNLGRDWKFLIRVLGVSEVEIENVTHDYTTMKERIHQCLLLWQQKEQQNASRVALANACRHFSVQRTDLANKLEDGNLAC